MDAFFFNLKETVTNFLESFVNFEEAIKKQNSSLPSSSSLSFINHVEAGKESGDKGKQKDADDMTIVEQEFNVKLES